MGGPRQVGKSALLHALHDQLGGAYVTLDVAAQLRASRLDPAGFLAGAARPLFLDEFQRGGDPLLLALKVLLDEATGRGVLALAGSTRFLSEPRLSESLAGRVRFVDLWPLTQSEIDARGPGTFVDAVFAGPEAVMDLHPERTSRPEVFERVCRGGFPEAVLLTDHRDRQEFFEDWTRTTTGRDVREIAQIGTGVDLARLCELLAALTATIVNQVELARDLGVTPQSARRYLDLLGTVYLHHQVPAWSRNLTAKVSHRPKLHLIDSGLAAALVGVDPDHLARPVAPAAGPLLETFVVGELAAQLTWAETNARLYHWRDRSGAEVDAVLERKDGLVTAIEVKASALVDRGDARWLRTLRDRLGEQFACGVVLHCGEHSLRLDDRILAIPISALWAPT